MTAMTIATPEAARAHILSAIECTSRAEVLDAIVQWNNTTENDIDEKGDVWVANPQTGHWLKQDGLIAFARFLC